MSVIPFTGQNLSTLAKTQLNSGCKLTFATCKALEDSSIVTINDCVTSPVKVLKTLSLLKTADLLLEGVKNKTEEIVAASRR